MTDKTENKGKTPFDEDDDTTRLEFIELKPVSFQQDQMNIPVSSGMDTKAIHPDEDLPSFPVSPEMWEEFDARFKTDTSDKRSEFVELPEEVITAEESPKSDERGDFKKDESVFIDDPIVEGETKSWKILLDPAGERAFGFSRQEYDSWFNKNRKNLKEVTCSNCSTKIVDNPFTGFLMCPNCGEKLTILKETADQIRDMKASAYREAQNKARLKEGFMTCPLDVPPSFIRSLSTPRFNFIFTDYYGVIGPLSAFIGFLGIWIPLTHLTTDFTIRQLLIIALGIAVVLCITSINKAVGIRMIKLNSDGITFFRFQSKKRIRFERIISIHLTNELSIWGSMKQQNIFLVILLTPFAVLTYILTLGHVNLFLVIHDRDAPSSSDNDNIQYVTVKTRGLEVKFKVTGSLHSRFSRFLGILIYLSYIHSPKLVVDPKALFAAQRTGRSEQKAA